MKTCDKIAMIGSKVLELLHWLAVVAMAAILVGSLVKGDALADILTKGISSQGTELTSYGYEITVVGSDGTINMTAVILFAITAIICLSLMAMVFRNVYLILRTASGQSSFANGNTPFQQDTIRMVREIGIFFISESVVCLIMSIIARFAVGIDAVELSVNLESLIMGVIALSLSRIFAYGMQLQKDVDGLV